MATDRKKTTKMDTPSKEHPRPFFTTASITFLSISFFVLLFCFGRIFFIPEKSTPSICPGSPSFVHASCQLSIQFDSPCSKVFDEILSRAQHKNGWADPHNGGKYTVTHVEDEKKDSGTKILEASRVTGDGQYTDKLVFQLESKSTENHECTAHACSESQVTSMLDFSTNYCNLRSLYCNHKEDGCPIVRSDLEYQETLSDCWQHDAKKCLIADHNTITAQTLEI